MRAPRGRQPIEDIVTIAAHLCADKPGRRVCHRLCQQVDAVHIEFQFYGRPDLHSHDRDPRVTSRLLCSLGYMVVRKRLPVKGYYRSSDCVHRRHRSMQCISPALNTVGFYQLTKVAVAPTLLIMESISRRQAPKLSRFRCASWWCVRWHRNGHRIRQTSRHQSARNYGRHSIRDRVGAVWHLDRRHDETAPMSLPCSCLSSSCRGRR
jgi:hypothetical protein